MSLKIVARSIRIYVVEDEPLISETIKMMLKNNGIQVVGTSDCFETALAEIKSGITNLALLDINLYGEKDGVDLAKCLDKLNVPYLFLTSQTDPSTIARVKEVKPLGFIVKPFTESGLLSNIELAWHKVTLQKEEYISIKSNGEHLKLNQAFILFVRAYDNYCYVVTNEKEYLLPHTLKSTAKKLNAEMFKKSHRSYLVNTSKIKAIKRNTIIIEDQEIPLSNTYKSEIENVLQ